MKYLVLLLVIALVVMLLGFKRREPGKPDQAKTRSGPASKTPLEMVKCAECGMHLPELEALPGRGGQFCSAEHRDRFEARQRGTR